MYVRLVILPCLLVLLTFTQGVAQLKANRLFSNNAVIQRDQPISIWGKDTPGNTVICSVGGKVDSSFVSSNGDWFVELENALEFNQEYTMVIESASGNLQFHGLVLGDVWLASGQSNMARSINTTIDTTGNLQYLDTLQNDQFENLRMFSIFPKQSKVDQRLIDAPLNSWHKWIKMTSIDLSRYQSAVAYYTGRRLHKELDYPIGIIVAAQGATRVEEWCPPEAADPDFQFSVPESSYFKGMISPIIPLSISGVIWYQGENNSGRPEFYAETFSKVFNAWQNRWSQDFPLFTTMLAGYQQDNFKKLRSEQLLAAHKNDHFYLASAFDLGVYDDIHPFQKKDVGERLASLILNEKYSLASKPYLYPEIVEGFNRNDSLLLKIDNHQGLKAQNEPLGQNMFKTYRENGEIIENEALFLSDSTIYLNTKGVYPSYFEYNYTGYAEDHIKLNGLPMHPYSSKFDNSFQYNYEYQPTIYVFDDSLGCYSESMEVLPILRVDTLNTPRKVRFINVSLAEQCAILKVDKTESDFPVYPNPSQGTLIFQDEVKQVVVYDQSGRVILKQENTHSVKINMPSEKLVFVKIILKSGETITEKIILDY